MNILLTSDWYRGSGQFAMSKANVADGMTYVAHLASWAHSSRNLSTVATRSSKAATEHRTAFASNASYAEFTLCARFKVKTK